MEDQCECEMLRRLVDIVGSTGMVRVPSGLVTQDDMYNADRAACDINNPNFIFLERECFVLSSGEHVQDPLGMQSSRLDSIWKGALVNTDALKKLISKHIFDRDEIGSAEKIVDEGTLSP